MIARPYFRAALVSQRSEEPRSACTTSWSGWISWRLHDSPMSLRAKAALSPVAPSRRGGHRVEAARGYGKTAYSQQPGSVELSSHLPE